MFFGFLSLTNSSEKVCLTLFWNEEDLQRDLSECLRQLCDNGANKMRKNSGVQVRVFEFNPKAV